MFSGVSCRIARRFDQDVGFALEDLLKVNFSLQRLGASVGEIGLDCRATIDDMLTAREKLLDAHGLTLPPGANVANSTRDAPTRSTGGVDGEGRGGGSRRGSVNSVGGSGYRSDSAASSGSVGTMAGGGRGPPGRRKPASAKALRARQATIKKRKASTGSGLFQR